MYTTEQRLINLTMKQINTLTSELKSLGEYRPNWYTKEISESLGGVYDYIQLRTSITLIKKPDGTFAYQQNVMVGNPQNRALEQTDYNDGTSLVCTYNNGIVKTEVIPEKIPVTIVVMNYTTNTVTKYHADIKSGTHNISEEQIIAWLYDNTDYNESTCSYMSHVDGDIHIADNINSSEEE